MIQLIPDNENTVQQVKRFDFLEQDVRFRPNFFVSEVFGFRYLLVEAHGVYIWIALANNPGVITGPYGSCEFAINNAIQEGEKVFAFSDIEELKKYLLTDNKGESKC